ncbi:aldose 1-epimerase family protein [Arsenicitalea aurantiaca]|uniref:Aldose 1-epimerase family protein n=1 Tax=Arsenicitalea aurantiaca TaxID=1783274 RepID=A0A433X839_9HYPH|nr:aldose 1-epimerase family protein [Arsenicitalea aurantiaca]RUT30236.1 aldose 1-epimerase family protein [Arsenicitalea aurantiaca]
MRIANDELSVEISPLGAELQSITGADGAEWLWHGDETFWKGRAPLLFPVVGKSPAGHVSIAGERFPMAPHGFTRTAVFAPLIADKTRCSFVLSDTEATRQSFPFAFALTVTHALEGRTLATEVVIENRDAVPMPFGFGFHPALRWPLPGSEGRLHRVTLESGGAPEMRRVDGEGLLRRGHIYPSPFVKGVLEPRHAHFAEDAMIFPDGAGPGLVFSAEGGRRVRCGSENLPDLALWTKPDAPFLCIEPWHGTAPEAGTGDALEDRPNTILLPPGETARFAMQMTFD